MAVTVDQFAGAVVSSGFIEADEIKTLWNSLAQDARPKTGEELAKLLIQRETLTLFQAQELLAGRGAKLQIGQYVIVDKIGAGGMGHVFRARHRFMKRVVAIKLLSPDRVKNEASIRRFEREVELAARLSHPNIVQAYDSGDLGGRHYLVMEYVDGVDLSNLIKQHGPRPVDEAVNYLTQAAQGLAFAHSQGVIHRDIKPSNLLVDKTGTIKILDMGLATFDDAQTSGEAGLTMVGQVLGTTDYMAPEQAMDMRKADARSDVYSLGCTFYRLLIGEPPYSGESVLEKLLAHREAPIPSLRAKRPEVPEAIDAIYKKMMAKKPDDRYQTAAELAAELVAYKQSAGATSGIHERKLTGLLREMSHAGGSPSASGVLSGGSSIGSGSSSVTLGASANSGTRLGSSASGKSLGGSKKLARADQTVAASAMPSGTIPTALPVAVPLDPTPEPESDQAPPWWRNRVMMIAAASVPLLVFGVIVAMISSGGKEDEPDQVEVETTTDGLAELRTSQGPYVPLPALSGMAAVSGKRPGFERWQVETVVPRGVNINTIAWSPDQKLLACATGNYVRLYDANTWQLVRFLAGHPGAVTGLAWSPDGEWLCSASRDGTVRLWHWDRTSGPVLSQQTGTGHRVAWSPDGKWIASGGDDKTVRLWKADGTVGPVMTGHAGLITCLAFSPDSKQLVSGSEDKTLRIWTIDGKFKHELKGHKNNVTCVSWGRDKMIASGSRDEKKVRLWFDIGAAGPVIDTSVYCLAWSPDGLMLGVGWNGKFRIFRSNGSADPDSVEKWGTLNAVAWSTDGKRIAWGGEGLLGISDPDGAQRSAIGYTTAAHSLSISADGSQIASAHDDGTVRFWTRDGKPGTVIQPPKENVRVNTVAWSPTTKQVAATYGDGFVRIWAPDGKAGPAVKVDSKGVNAVSWSPDGKQFVTRITGDLVLKIWNADGKPGPELKGHVRGVLGVDWGRDGLIASCSDDGTIRYWTSDGKPGPYFSPGHAIDRLKWRPDGKQLIADVRSVGCQLWTTAGSAGAAGGGAVHLAWSPDGKFVLKSSSNGAPTTMLPDGKSAAGLSGHAGTQCLDWSSDNRIVVGCSDSTIRAWDAATRKVIWVSVVLSNGESALFTPEGQLVSSATNVDKNIVYLAGGANGQIDVYKQKEFQKLADKGVAEATKVVELDRRAAEWVLKTGGTVRVTEFGKSPVDIKPKTALPTGPFWVTAVSMTGKKTLDEDELENLQGLTELEELILNDSDVGDVGLEDLDNLPKLRRLHLHATNVTVDGLKYLLRLPSLVDLNLNNTTLGDPAVKPLSLMNRLTVLMLKGTKFSQHGIEKVRASLPKCKVDWDPPQ